MSRQTVIQMAEVRRGLEAEVAGLAAQRHTPAQSNRIQQAIAALDPAVQSGGDGVEEDVNFHKAIADAAQNPFLTSTLQF